MIPRILVTGSNGQLGKCLRDIDDHDFDIHYVNSSELDITNHQQVKDFFEKHKIDWCINCAAYTAVDKAESDYDSAFNVNVTGPKNLAKACKVYNVKLIHISTDFVFDGEHNKPYKESDPTNPIGVYGETKLKGEQEISKSLKEHFILRTSWLYSEHGGNFLKTMLRLSKDKAQLGVVGDQIGTPTYAKDLAKAIFLIIGRDIPDYGIYHYSNNGVASWYDFAKAIFDISKTNIQLNNISTAQFPTLAKRPHFSVLDKTKIETTLKQNAPYWRDSLIAAIQNIKNE
ncbi:dTDP-4-dehydrorhamnose reductase [Winogradskyella aquimaris]|uniref:dTDP-4-dehydrorhamnose reductase n=1 Tax=Winogradskyella aquimaris TaxID=864074 RepID=A0ABU5ELW0_9FLAO|nr:dTDP-4-dehydrorhamnose reductase [Winogradskyella aquimaris]MDY2586490.1 dTDP-4-dehydrorhamnose reductase [Winogradskyella aquimaris]